uniref:Uncharacterized protein n=1 Tax=Arundo donax TaxID=35708 RepID=A0A0A9DKE5_ARUDO
MFLQMVEDMYFPTQKLYHRTTALNYNHQEVSSCKQIPTDNCNMSQPLFQFV